MSKMWYTKVDFPTYGVENSVQTLIISVFFLVKSPVKIRNLQI